MALRSILEKTWNQDLLFSVLVELTFRCNLDCFFCYNDLSAIGEPLRDEQYFQLFEDLAALQVMNLTFTGGEPLAHPSFLALGARARELGFVVRIKSNGHAFRGNLARRIRDEVDPFLVETSLHGADAATHDRQTRVPGSFDRLLGNLEELRSIGFRIKLNATLTRWNEHQIEEMFDLADRLDCRLSISPSVTPRDDGDRGPLAIAPSDEGVLRLYRFLDTRVSDREAAAACTGSPSIRKSCGAGSSGLAIDPFGNVLPCVQWRRPIGNLHEQGIGEIWRGSGELEEIRRLNGAAKQKLVALGPDAAGLSHCLGLSEEKTGDPLATDPEAWRQAGLLRRAREQNGRSPLLPILGQSQG